MKVMFLYTHFISNRSIVVSWDRGTKCEPLLHLLSLLAFMRNVMFKIEKKVKARDF